MKNTRENSMKPVRPMDAELLELELQVAHRADELWQNDGPGRNSDLAYWMRAEREVMERRLSYGRAVVPA